MQKGQFILLLVLVFLVSQCAIFKERRQFRITEVQGSIAQTGLINCFQAGLKSVEGNPVYCESSAVLKVGDQLFIASDKSIPDTNCSPVFSMAISLLDQLEIPSQEVEYQKIGPFLQAEKIEAFAASPNGKYFIASTAFDRVLENTAGLDLYNALIYWRANRTEYAYFLNRTDNQGIISSRGLRPAFSKVLANEQFPDGMPYFKVEGLAILPKDKILFGIREQGASYKTPEFTFTILASKLEQEKSGLKVDPRFDRLYDFKPMSHPMIDQPLGLSSLEYHHPSRSLLALTSLEVEEGGQKQLATYIWVISNANLNSGAAPTLILDAAGQPLLIPHKGEGLTFLDDDTLLVICDEDRELTPTQVGEASKNRQANQGVYVVVELDW